MTEPEGVRLQKVLAHAGVASRRVVEDMIVAGRVTVNGEPATELGRRIDPEVDLVAVDGQAVQLDSDKRYVMLNKPRGVISTMSDEQGRPDLSEFADQFDERLYNVGRLDGDTSGLLLLTNDGELANVMAHPRFGVEKTYVAKVRGRVKQSTLARLMRGVELDDGPIAADRARILSTTAQGGTLLEVTLHSGRNRIVRRMLDAVGHPVIELVRRQFGPLHLGTLSSGQMRDLTKMELGQILTLMRADESGADTETASAEADAGLADAEREIENGGS
jgi:23S rRNA pseudouridine2605 synthase/16S rRNA pseudouridine516 synthase